MRLYASITDHINKNPYDCITPSWYLSDGLPDVMMQGELAPFNSGPGFKGMDVPVRSMQTISSMIAMCNTRVQFTIINDKDLLEIFHYVDAYILEAEEAPGHSEEITNYVKKAVIFRKRLEHNFKRILNLNPEWKYIYEGNNIGIVRLINKLAAQFGVDKDTYLKNARTPVKITPAPNVISTMSMEDRLKAVSSIEYGV